jgi:hypothetical protein
MFILLSVAPNKKGYSLADASGIAFLKLFGGYLGRRLNTGPINFGFFIYSVIFSFQKTLKIKRGSTLMIRTTSTASFLETSGRMNNFL